MQTEFKLFIDPDEVMGTKTKKTKLRELVTTVVAFANTQGGRFYIGIDDECGICGVGQELQRWAEAAVSDDSVERYRGAVTSNIRISLTAMFRCASLVDGTPVFRSARELCCKRQNGPTVSRVRGPRFHVDS